MKVRDCEKDGYRLWGDHLLWDWVKDEPDRDIRDLVVGWVVVLLDTPREVAGTPVPGTEVETFCAFVPGTDVGITWFVDHGKCIVWIIEVESLADLGG